MITVVAKCLKCEDRGVLWRETFAGAWINELCDCRPPEYWAKQSDETLENLMKWVQEVEAG